MTLKQVKLELARTADFPNGCTESGYRFYAPLDKNGHLDKEAWKNEKSKCTVVRFWKGRSEETGHLVCHRGGVWAFSYDPSTTEDDEPIFRFDRHCFVEGDYISITEHDGVQRPFRIVSVS